MSESVTLTWAGFRQQVLKLSIALFGRDPRSSELSGIYGIPTGGCFVAQELSRLSLVPLNLKLLDLPLPGCLVVDDIVDSGATIQLYSEFQTAAVFASKRYANSVLKRQHVTVASISDEWVTFPWEVGHPSQSSTGPTDAVVRLLQYIGEDPKRDGLKRTPARVARALREMTQGMREDPEIILSVTFDQLYDEVIILRDIPFVSLCEHHMLPFSGTVDIGYIPGKVVGLSKLARLVDCFSQRLQIQERLTVQIAESIKQYLNALGVAVVVKAVHSCMSCRGVKKTGAEMVTSAMLGVFREKTEARAEFLSLCK